MAQTATETALHPRESRQAASPPARPSLRKSDSFLLQNLEGIKRFGACRLRAGESRSSQAPRPEEALPRLTGHLQMWAHDSGGERLTAARSHHMPRLWGTPELKDKQAVGEAGVAWNGKQ